MKTISSVSYRFLPLLLASIFSWNSFATDPITTKSFSASGNNEFVFEIQKWGRYVIEAKSPNGALIELYNKKSGLITQSGTIGEKDGRIDILLDIGEFKVKTSSPQKGKGTLAVSVYPFKGADGSSFPELPLQKLDWTECKDLEQVSWWIHVPSDTLVFLEIQGRQIADVALWLNGTWRVDCQNIEFINKKNPEKPLRGCRIIENLKKGNYLVTAYGGKYSSWSVKDSTYPVFAQYGLSPLRLPAEYRFTIPETGVARFALSSGTQAVVLESGSKNTMYLETFSMNARSDFNRVNCDSIFSKSSTPRTIVHCNGNAAIVTVSGNPGDPFKLTTLGSTSTSVSVPDSGLYYVSTFTTGKPEDLPGVSGFIYDRYNGKILAMQADTVSGSKQLRKKFNLLANVNTWLWIEEDGYYTIETDQAVEYQLTRFYAINTPENNPVLGHKGIATEALKKGLYSLNILASKKGFCTFLVSKSMITGALTASVKSAIGLDDFKAQPPKLYWQIPQIQLPGSAVIMLNDQSPEFTAIGLQHLPHSMDIPLTLYCRAGEQIDIPVRFQSARILKVAIQSGKNVQMLVDKASYTGAVLDSGKYTISVGNNSDALSQVIITALLPQVVNKEKVMVSYSDPLPVIATDKPVFFDIGQSDRTDYQFSIKEAGIYRIETSGRLATGIQIRDRLLQFVRSAEEKGIGRNAIFIDYLLPGQYMISVNSEGSSAGHLSLLVKRDELIDGGKLDNSIEKRSLVSAYKGIKYEIAIREKGAYNIQSFGRNTAFNVRIEDKYGWPIVQHGISSPVDVNLEKNAYRLISLPVAYESRRIAKLTLTGNRPALKGKGSHTVKLNEPLTAKWQQINKNDSIPVLFECSIPATIDASLIVSPEFKAVMRKKDSDSEIVSWSGKKSMRVPSGDYEIRVAPKKSRNHITYQLSVQTKDLVPGCHYTIDKEKLVRVQVDKKGVYELFSQGMMDVSAKLLAENAKTVVAQNDDGFLDWNFSISKVLDTGRYFLKIISEESSFSGTEVFMKAISDTVFSQVQFDKNNRFAETIDMKGKVVVLPLGSIDQFDVFSTDVEGQSRVAGIVERQTDNGWVTVGEYHSEKFKLSVPLIKGQAYRLKVWSEDHINENIQITANLISSKQVSIDEMFHGSGFHADDNNGYAAYFCVDMKDMGPGNYAVESDNGFITRVTSTDDPKKGFFEERGQFVSANSSQLFVEVVFGKQGGQKIKLVPVLIQDKGPVSVQMYRSKARTYDVENKKDALTIISIAMNPGQPLGGIVSSDGKNVIWKHNGQTVRNGQYYDDNYCAVPCFPEDIRKITLWNASGSDESFATVNAVHYVMKDGGSLPDSYLMWSNNEEEAITYKFPDNSAHTLQIILPPGSGVIYRSAQDERECIFSGNAVRNVSITGNGGRLYLFRNNKNNVLKADVFINRCSTQDNSGLQSGASVCRQFTSGKTVLSVNGVQKGKQQLYWGGAVRDLQWIDDEGKLRGPLKNYTTVDNVAGHLVIESEGGWGKVGLCTPGDSSGIQYICQWESGSKPEKPVEINSSVKVSLHDGINWFKINIKDTVHVHFNAQTTLSILLMKEKSPVCYQDAWDVFDMDIPLFSGTYYLGVKELAGRSLEGAEFTTAFREITLLSEKKPFTTFVGPGESKMVKFSISSKSMYGIGIAMKNETIEAMILDSKLVPVSAGKQHYISLLPGIYYLWFSIPSTSEGTEMTTYLFGQDAPPNEPPEYLVKWIINGAEGERPTAESQAQYTAPQVQWNDYDYNSQSNYSSENNNEENQESEYSEDSGNDEQVQENSGSDENYNESDDNSGDSEENGEATDGDNNNEEE
jgi:hypothetical protein